MSTFKTEAGKTAAAVLTASLVFGIGSIAHAAGDAEPGLPQLKVETWPSQLFWLAVIFAVGYVFMSRVVTPRTAFLEDRTDPRGDYTRHEDVADGKDHGQPEQL